LAFVGCKKDGGDKASLPSDLVPKAAVVDTSKLKAPALFAYIPADTPYVIGSFESFPVEYWKKMKKAVAPVFKNLFSKKAYDRDSESSRMMDAIVAELDGKWDEKGLESLGFSSQPRFAVFGLGLAPVVARIELKDDKVVLETIQRVAQRGGATLPEQKTLGDRKYWRFDERDLSIIVALNDNQLIAGFGPSARVDATLSQILGVDKPKDSMADGKVLAEAMTRHGFGPYIVGFADTAKLAAAAAAYRGHDLPAECSAAVDKVAKQAPGVAMGYTEISSKRATGGIVLELSNALRDELKALQTDVPGLAEAMADEPMMAFGGGIDMVKAQKLGQRAAMALHDVGEACHSHTLLGFSEDMSLAMSQPLPEPLAQITGGVIALQSLKMSSSGMPDSVDAYGMITAQSGKKLYDSLVAAIPTMGQLGIKADGSLHKAEMPIPLPFEFFTGVGDHAIVIASGEKGKRLAEKALTAQPSGKVPLFVASYDYGQLMALQKKLGSMFGSPTDPADAMGEVFGRASFSCDVNDHGLMLWGNLEMK